MGEEQRKRARAGEAEETAETPRNALDALAAAAAAAGSGCSAAATLVLSDSKSTGEAVEVTSDSRESGRCEHLFMDSEDVDMIVSDIKSAGKPATCEHFRCRASGRGAARGGKEKAGLMVCPDCDTQFCAGVAGSDNPQGHARWHASMYRHWVALWYHDPYTGYCFLCEHNVMLHQDSGNSEGGTTSENGKDEWGMVVSDDAGGRVSGRAIGDGCVIRGIPNLGNTCYMNALVQCLLALSKLRTMMLIPDVLSGTLGLLLKDLFVETSSANDARHMLNPLNLLEYMRTLDPRFKGNHMQDSHEFLVSLRNSLNKEAEDINKLHHFQGGAVAPAISDSIFRGQLSDTTFCKFCPNNSVKHEPFYDLQVSLPSKGPPARSVASPPMDKSSRSQRKICKKLFEPIDGSNTEKIQTIGEGGDSQIPGSEFEDVAMEKTSKPLHVGSTEVTHIWQSKDVVHGRLQTQKNDDPGEIIEVPIKAVDFLPNLFDEGIGESTADSHNPEDMEQPPLVSIEAKENMYTVEASTEGKGKAQSSDIVYDGAEHMNSLASIEECLALHFKEGVVEWHCDNCSNVAKLPSTNGSKDSHFKEGVVEWHCDNCSNVAKLPSTNGSKDSEHMAASTNVNTTVDGDQTEQSDRKTCTDEQSSDLNSLEVECASSSRQPHDSDAQHQVILSVDRVTKGITSGMSCGKKDSASCSTVNKEPECHEGVQEVVPCCLPTEKQTNLLNAQDSQDASIQNQSSGKQVKLDDHSAHKVKENQNEQKDRNGGSIQTHFISKLPPVLTIQLKRYTSVLSKLRGHVSFKEILDVGPFMHPSSEDKDNSSYRLVGVVEHRGLVLSGGHYVAYVRADHKQQSNGSSSWFRASDTYIREVSLEEVLGCEAYLLFYERMED